MKIDEEDDEEIEIKKEEMVAEKWRSSNEKDVEGILGYVLEVFAIPLSHIHHHEQDKEKIDGEGEEMVMKDR